MGRSEWSDIYVERGGESGGGEGGAKGRGDGSGPNEDDGPGNAMAAEMKANQQQLIMQQLFCALNQI